MTAPKGIADWGPLVLFTDIDDALLGQLREWFPTYLGHAGEEKGLAKPPPAPRTYANVMEGEEFLDSQLPAILVTTAETPKVIGGATRFYEAVWSVKVSCVVRGRKGHETRRNAALYEGALRQCLIQKGAAGPASKVHWLSSKLMPVTNDSRNSRYLAAGTSDYNVSTDIATQGFGGPDIPNAAPYLDLAKVVETKAETKPNP